MTNAEKYLRQQIPTMVGENHVASMKLTTMIALLHGYHESEVKNIASNTVLAAVPDVDKGHGKCKEKNCEKWATIDYNGHGHWVCKGHYESLSNYFDEEYR